MPTIATCGAWLASMPTYCRQHQAGTAPVYDKRVLSILNYAAAYAMAMSCHADRIGFGHGQGHGARKNEVARLWRMVDAVSVRMTAWLLPRCVGCGLCPARPPGSETADRPSHRTEPQSGWCLGNRRLDQCLVGKARGRAGSTLAVPRRLDPGLAVRLYTDVDTAHAYFFLGRYEEAVGCGRADAPAQSERNIPLAYRSCQCGVCGSQRCGTSDCRPAAGRRSGVRCRSSRESI